MKNIVSIECPLQGYPKGTELRHYSDGSSLVVLPDTTEEQRIKFREENRDLYGRKGNRKIVRWEAMVLPPEKNEPKKEKEKEK